MEPTQNFLAEILAQLGIGPDGLIQQPNLGQSLDAPAAPQSMDDVLSGILGGEQRPADAATLEQDPLRGRDKVSMILAALGDAFAAKVGRPANANAMLTHRRDASLNRRQDEANRVATGKQSAFDRDQSRQIRAGEIDYADRREDRAGSETISRDDRLREEKYKRETDALQSASMDELKNTAMASGVWHTLTEKERKDPEAIADAVSRHIRSKEDAPDPANDKQLETEYGISEKMSEVVNGNLTSGMPNLAARLRSEDPGQRLAPDQVRREFRRMIDPDLSGGRLTDKQRSNLARIFNEDIEPVLEAYEKHKFFQGGGKESRAPDTGFTYPPQPQPQVHPGLEMIQEFMNQRSPDAPRKFGSNERF